MQPVRVVVITDRRLVAGDELADRLAAIVAAVPRGSVLFQVREKDLDGGPMLHLAREVVELARPAGAPVWVNDRADVAVLSGADGVHLPERGLAIGDARAVAAAGGRTLAIGCSRHSAEGTIAAASAGAALVQLGPIWATPSKEGVIAPLGLSALGVRAHLPGSARLVAVGGVDGPARARFAVAAGADAVAVIRAAWTADDPAASVAALVSAVDEARAARR